MAARKLVPSVTSLMDLRVRALRDARYVRLAQVAAHNLGGLESMPLDKALAWLTTNALETSEEGVVDEVNDCRDLLD